MFDRSIRALGNVSLALLLPCLVLAFAALPTTALADNPPPVPGRHDLPPAGGRWRLRLLFERGYRLQQWCCPVPRSV